MFGLVDFSLAWFGLVKLGVIWLNVFVARAVCLARGPGVLPAVSAGTKPAHHQTRGRYRPGLSGLHSSLIPPLPARSYYSHHPVTLCVGQVRVELREVEAGPAGTARQLVEQGRLLMADYSQLDNIPQHKQFVFYSPQVSTAHSSGSKILLETDCRS